METAPITFEGTMWKKDNRVAPIKVKTDPPPKYQFIIGSFSPMKYNRWPNVTSRRVNPTISSGSFPNSVTTMMTATKKAYKGRLIPDIFVSLSFFI